MGQISCWHVTIILPVGLGRQREREHCQGRRVGEEEEESLHCRRVKVRALPRRRRRRRRVVVEKCVVFGRLSRSLDNWVGDRHGQRSISARCSQSPVYK